MDTDRLEAGRRRAARTALRRPWPVSRYLLVIAAVAVLALIVGSWYGSSWAAGHARSSAVTELSFQATRSAESMSSAIEQGKQTVSGLASQKGLEAVFAKKDNGCTLNAAGGGAFPEIRLDISNTQGQVGCSSSKSPAVFASNVHQGSSWLPQAVSASTTKVFWDVPDAVTGAASIVVTAPVHAASGQAVGAIALFLHIPPSAAALAHDFAGSSQAGFALIDSSRRVLSTSAFGAAKAGQRLPGNRTGEWKGADGAERLFTSRPVPGTDWRVYVGVPSDQVYAAARGGLLRGFLVGLAAIALLGFALVLLNRRVAGPLRAVTQAVVAAGRDPGATRVQPSGTAELVTLAAEVNAMLDVRAGHEAQLTHQAMHDPLTGLPNAVLFRDRLEIALARGRETSGLAVLSLGVDRFRLINDALGPDAADRILIELCDRLSNLMQPGETLARLGGDHFGVLCEDVEDAEHAVRIAQRIRGGLTAAFHPSTDPVVVSATAGIALAQEHEGSPTASQLLREADSAMHVAKAAGSDWALSDQTEQVRASHYLDTERALRQALDRGQLRVHYQPLLDVGTGKVVGAEALVRWQHPTRGLVPPMEFIPVAEETGQISAIGSFVLREACAEAARWARAGHVLTISVNVAVGQLRDPGFVTSVRQALTAASLPANRLCLEVTESAMMRATGTETATLEALRMVGVRLAIDDFGTGYSSLAYLHQMSVHELKIDRSFVNRIEPGNRDAHLVEAIMGMAHALGLEVVAEGVETAQQLEFLADLNCQYAQGYLFSPPVPATTFRDQLEARSTADRVESAAAQ